MEHSGHNNEKPTWQLGPPMMPALAIQANDAKCAGFRHPPVLPSLQSVRFPRQWYRFGLAAKRRWKRKGSRAAKIRWWSTTPSWTWHSSAIRWHTGTGGSWKKSTWLCQFSCLMIFDVYENRSWFLMTWILTQMMAKVKIGVSKNGMTNATQKQQKKCCLSGLLLSSSSSLRSNKSRAGHISCTNLAYLSPLWMGNRPGHHVFLASIYNMVNHRTTWGSCNFWDVICWNQLCEWTEGHEAGGIKSETPMDHK